MPRRTLSLIAAVAMLPSLLLLGLVPSRPAVAADDPGAVIVVGGDAFRGPLEPWVQFRKSQGYEVRWLTNEGSAEAIRDRLRSEYERSRFDAVLLLGDVVVAGQRTSLQTPTHYREAKVNVKWGSEPEIASDFPYSELTGDHLPDVAIGRLPADTPAELARQAKRIIDYEREQGAGRWQTKINFVAGVGGFGALTDMVLEMTTKAFLTDGVPPAYHTTMTYGSWRSPYCPNPRDFHRICVERLNEGCLFWVYIGHGQVRYLDSIRVPGRRYGIFTTLDAPKLKAKHPPIAVFLSCYAGAFDKPDDCLAEEMFRQPGGPIAVFSGSRVTMPYAMAVMSHALGKLYFQEREVVLGELIRRAKCELAEPPEEAGADSRRQLLDRLAAAISPAPNLLDAERREHLLLFNLIGDPLLRLPLPQTTRVQAPEEARAGETVEIKIEGTGGGGVLELACRRDQLRSAVPHRQAFDTDPLKLAQYNSTYEFANNPVYWRQKIQLSEGQTRVSLPIPAEARGHCYVNLHLEKDGQLIVGSAPIYVRPQATPATVNAEPATNVDPATADNPNR